METVTNTAHVQANETDPNGGNDTDSESTDVVARADLRLDKTDSPDPVVAGDTLTYTLTAINDGPSDARQVVVADTLPTGVTPSGVQTCSWPVIPAGESRQCQIVVQVNVRHAGNHPEYSHRQLRHGRSEFGEQYRPGSDDGGHGTRDLRLCVERSERRRGVGCGRTGAERLDGLLGPERGRFAAGGRAVVRDSKRRSARWGFRFANLPPGTYVVREWVPDSWRQTFPAGGDGAHLVTPPIQGGFGQTAAPNFGNNPLQVMQFITPLSVLRHDVALVDRRFIRPADDPLTAWQGLNPSLPLQDYLNALVPWQSFPVQNASATTLRYTVSSNGMYSRPATTSW